MVEPEPPHQDKLYADPLTGLDEAPSVAHAHVRAPDGDPAALDPDAT